MMVSNSLSFANLQASSVDSHRKFTCHFSSETRSGGDIDAFAKLKTSSSISTSRQNIPWTRKLVPE